MTIELLAFLDLVLVGGILIVEVLDVLRHWNDKKSPSRIDAIRRRIGRGIK